MKRLLSLAVAVACLSGCGSTLQGAHVSAAHEHGGATYGQEGGRGAALANLAGAIADLVALASDGDEQGTDDRPRTDADVPMFSPSPAPGPPLPPLPPHQDAPAKARVPFDQAGARAALDAVDLSSCVSQGAPVGYGHAQVTFGIDGAVAQVVVDGGGLSREAAECVRSAFADAETAPFDGPPVAVRTTYYLR